MPSGFEIRSDINQAVQPQKIAKGLKCRIKEEWGLYYLLAKTEALISCAIPLLSSNEHSNVAFTGMLVALVM